MTTAGFLKYPKYLFDIPELWEVENDYHRKIMYLMRRADESRVRGQFTVTQEVLADRWGCTRRQVNSILNKLEGWGIIERRGTNRFTLITVHLEERFGGVQQKTQSTQGFESDFDEISVQQSSQQSSQQTSHFKQDYKDYKDLKTNSSSTRACENEDFEEMKGEGGLLESVAMLNHVTVDAVIQKIDEFKAHCIAGEKRFLDKGELRRHFRDWCRIRIEDEKKQMNHGAGTGKIQSGMGAAANRANNRGAYEVTGLEDYSGERL